MIQPGLEPLWSNPHSFPLSLVLCGPAWYKGDTATVITVVIIIIFCGSDSANRKLLVRDQRHKEVFFLSFSFPPNMSPRVFSWGVGIGEMSLGLSGKVSC